MGGKLTYRNDILAMEPKALETFVHRWVARMKREYVDHQEFGNAHDLGRDVVGFATDRRHEGDWDNYQCKKLAKPVDDGTLFEEVGKVLYYAAQREFTPPRRYVFVAPKGFNRKAEHFLNNPSAFKTEMLDEWETRCARKVRKRLHTPLTDEVRAVVSAYRFEAIEGMDIDKMLTLEGIEFVLADTFGEDPGEAPRGQVPDAVSIDEAGYVEQLISVYSEHVGAAFVDAAAVAAHGSVGAHFTMQRRRYFEADAFQRHFRDNLDPRHLSQFNDEIHSAVFDVHAMTTGYDRVNSVMAHAGNVDVSGIFGKHKRASAQVKQGTCHHLVNDGILKWTE